MIRVQDDRVQVYTDARPEDWFYRLRRRLLVLSAAVKDPQGDERIRDAISAELEEMIEMLPEENQLLSS